jgi:hypothetical protein
LIDFLQKCKEIYRFAKNIDMIAPDADMPDEKNCGFYLFALEK